MKILFRASKADINFLPLCRANFTRSREEGGGVAPWRACHREPCPVSLGSLCWRLPDSEVSSLQVRSGRGTGVNLAKMSGDEQMQGSEDESMTG